MYSYSRICENDEDYALFTLFFLQHRQQFNEHYTLDVALMHLIETMEHSSILFICNAKQKIIGTAHYWSVSEGSTFDASGKVVFVSSALLAPEERNSRTFLHGIKDLVARIRVQMPYSETMKFHAEASNRYTNQLYSKFAQIIGVDESEHGLENIYEVSIDHLEHFIRRLKP